MKQETWDNIVQLASFFGGILVLLWGAQTKNELLIGVGSGMVGPPTLARGPKLTKDAKKAVAPLLVLALVGVFMVGCTSQPTTGTASGMERKGLGNSASMTEGEWAVFTDADPAQMVIDDKGLNHNASTPHRAMGIVYKGVKVFNTSPGAITIGRVELTMEDGTSLLIEDYGAEVASTIEAYNERIIQMLLSQEVISEQDAQMLREATAAGKDIFVELGKLGINAFAPGASAVIP